MKRLRVSIPAVALTLAAATVDAQPRTLIVDTIECDTTVSWPILVQSDRDAAPEWAVLAGRELVVSEMRPGAEDRLLQIPEGTSLFDLRDLNRDGATDLAAIRGEYLDYWPDGFRADSMEPAARIHQARFSALAYGGARPARLFLSIEGQQLLSAPVEGEPQRWTLDGAAVAVPTDDASAPPALIFSQAWDAAPGAASMRGADEYQIVQQFQAPLTDPGRRSEDATVRYGARFARDAADAPPSEWPSFRLRPATGDRVAFALAPPDFQDTLIHVRRAEFETTPRPPAPRLVPGILIVPGGRAPDVNGDGYADMVLWRSARPAPTLDALARAAQTGGWAIVVTVHPFEPAKGRFASRPVTWFRTEAPLISVLSMGVAGPFAYVHFDDVDGDGRDEMLTTGAGDEVVIWKFTGDRVATPTYRAALGDAVLAVEFTARDPDFGWLGVVRTSRAFHALTLPDD